MRGCGDDVPAKEDAHICSDEIYVVDGLLEVTRSVCITWNFKVSGPQ